MRAALALCSAAAARAAAAPRNYVNATPAVVASPVDGDGRVAYASLAHCAVPDAAAPALRAFLDRALDRAGGRRRGAARRSLRERAGACAPEVEDQLAEEWLSWWGFCDWSRYEIPPLTGFSGTPSVRSYNIAYFVIVHADFPFVERQLAALWDASNLYVYFRRADVPQTGRGDAAAATWIFCGDEAPQRRGRDVDIPWG